MRFSRRDVAFAVMILGWYFAPAPLGAQDPASGSGSPGASSTAGARQPTAPAKPKKMQIAKLETKRQQFEEQINEVYEEARKKGIVPGQLR